MPTRLSAAALILILCLISTIGCSSATYKGAFLISNEAPDAYIGVRFKSGIDRKSEYHHPYESPVASLSQTE